MIAAFWPDRETEENEGRRMARAMMRYRRDVLPAPERWWDGGGEMSSMMGGVGDGRRASRSGVPENIFAREWDVSLLIVSCM